MPDKKGFRYVSHTADVAFIAYGSTPAELISNSLYAMFGIMYDAKKLGTSMSPRRSIRLSVSANDMEELLWASLQKALSLSAARFLFPYRVVSSTSSRRGKKISFRAVMDAVEKSEAAALFEVKGVSRYSLKITESNGVLSSKVVLDV